MLYLKPHPLMDGFKYYLNPPPTENIEMVELASFYLTSLLSFHNILA
jgi:hypothetical protein